MVRLYTVSEVAERYNVTPMGVRFWLKNGLRHQREKVVGVKVRIVIDLKDVDEYLAIGLRKG